MSDSNPSRKNRSERFRQEAIERFKEATKFFTKYEVEDILLEKMSTAQINEAAKKSEEMGF